MQRGEVVYFDDRRGFGFIKPRPGSDHLGDVFFHISAVAMPYREDREDGMSVGTQVQFSLAQDPTNPKRFKAVSVVVGD